MAKLSLSEVSKQFHIDRSTIYRGVRNGRLSRSSDGQFDLAEVIRCFGEPTVSHQKENIPQYITDDATQKLIKNLENEVKKYQDREERLLQQIDRMQTLIELKSVVPTTATQHQDTTACNSDMPQYDETSQNTENKEFNESIVVKSVAVPEHDAIARHVASPQHATLQNVAMQQSKKRGLFRRLLKVVLDD